MKDRYLLQNFESGLHSKITWEQDTIHELKLPFGVDDKERCINCITLYDGAANAVIISEGSPDSTLHTLLTTGMLKYSPDELTIDFVTMDASGSFLKPYSEHNISKIKEGVLCSGDYSNEVADRVSMGADQYYHFGHVATAEDPREAVRFLDNLYQQLIERTRTLEMWGERKLEDLRKHILHKFAYETGIEATWHDMTHCHEEHKRLVLQLTDNGAIDFSRHLIVFHDFAKIFDSKRVRMATRKHLESKLLAIMKVGRSCGYHFLFVDSAANLNADSIEFLNNVALHIVGRVIPELSMQLLGSTCASFLKKQGEYCIDNNCGTMPEEISQWQVLSDEDYNDTALYIKLKQEYLGYKPKNESGVILP